MAEFFKILGEQIEASIDSSKAHGPGAVKIPKTPDDEYQAALAGFHALRDHVTGLAASASAFSSQVAGLGKSMEQIAERFDQTLTAEGDAEEAVPPAVDSEAGFVAATSFKEGASVAVVDAFNEHVVAPLQDKALSLQRVDERIHRRRYLKEEYDYFVDKLQQRQERAEAKPEKTHREERAAKLEPRVAAAKAALDEVTVPLIEYFAAVDALRPRIVAREFQKYKASQRILFALGAEKFKVLDEDGDAELVTLPPPPTVAPAAKDTEKIAVEQAPETGGANGAGVAVAADGSAAAGGTAATEAATQPAPAKASSSSSAAAGSSSASTSSSGAKEFFDKAVADMSAGFVALKKHKHNALALGKVPVSPDEEFETAANDALGLRAHVGALAAKTGGFADKVQAFTLSLQSLATGFAAVVGDEGDAAKAAAEAVAARAAGTTAEGLNANVVAHLRNKVEAPAGRELFKKRQEFKTDYDYYHFKVQHIEEKTGKPEHKEKKLAANVPKLEAVRAQLQTASEQLLAFFAECKEVRPRVVAHEYEQFKANQREFFEAAAIAFQVVEDSADVAEPVPVPSVREADDLAAAAEASVAAEEEVAAAATAAAAAAKAEEEGRAAADADASASASASANADADAAADADTAEADAAEADAAEADATPAAPAAAQEEEAVAEASAGAGAAKPPPIPPAENKKRPPPTVKEFFEDAGQKIGGAFEALRKHNVNALAIGHVPPTPDDSFAQGAAAFFSLKADVVNLAGKATSLAGSMEAFADALDGIVQEFADTLAVDGTEPTVDAAAAAQVVSDFAGQVRRQFVAPLKQHVIAPLESKQAAIAAVDVRLKQRREMKQDHDYYFQKVQKLEAAAADKGDTGAEAEKQRTKLKKNRNVVKLREAKLALFIASAPLLTLFEDVKALGAKIMAYEFAHFKRIQKHFFSAGAERLQTLAPSTGAELLPMPALQDDVDIVLNAVEADLSREEEDAPADAGAAASSPRTGDDDDEFQDAEGAAPTAAAADEAKEQEQEPATPGAPAADTDAAEAEEEQASAAPTGSVLPTSVQTQQTDSGPGTPRFPSTPKSPSRDASSANAAD